jgi:DNA-binding MltR family transcriptional regulator
MKTNTRKSTGKIKPHSISSQSYSELGQASDRAAAIVGESILNTILSILLASIFVESQAIAESLLYYPGSLSGLSSKACLIFLLGRISNNQLEDLKAISAIRNRFAHSLEIASFTDPSLRSYTKRLASYRRFAGDTPETPRENYKLAVSVLAYSLAVEISAATHIPELKAVTITGLLKNLGSSPFVSDKEILTKD